MKKLLLLAFQLGFLLPQLSGQSTASYLKSAEEAFAAKDYATAYIHAKEVLKRDSSANLDLLKMAMMASVEVCEFDQAEQYMRTISSIAPEDNDPILTFYRAKNQHRQGNYEEAIQAYDDFIGNSGSNNPELVALAKKKAAECNTLLSSPLVNEPLEMESLTMLADLSTPGQSDFAMPLYKDNIIVGKTTPPEQCECEKPCSDKISLLQRDLSGAANKLALPKSFKKVGHITYAKEGQRAYFTSCKCKDDTYICEIYYADKVAGEDNWSSPVKLPAHINHGNGSTSTQPFYLEGNDKDNGILFYVSDFNGGNGTGDLNIYYSVVTGNDHKPSNPMSKINTPGDEVTPYFHKTSNTFFFSSNGYMTLGGYDFDIFKYTPTDDDITSYLPAPTNVGDCFSGTFANSTDGEVLNMGSPINTEFDDLFFSKEEGSQRMIFSSNREGHNYAELQHCCPDVFEAKYVPTANIEVTLVCQGELYCAGDISTIEDLRSEDITWKPESLPKANSRKGNSFLFTGIPLERDLNFTASVEGYDVETKTINSGICDGDTVRFTLILTPILRVAVNFQDACGNDFSARIDSVALLEIFESGSSSPLQGENFTYELCPNRTYRFAVTGGTFKFSPDLNGLEINTFCKPLDAEYTIIVEDEGIKEDLNLPLYFDHDIPRPEMLVVDHRASYLGRDSTNYRFNYSLGPVAEAERVLANDTLSYDYYYRAFSSSKRKQVYNDFARCNSETNAIPSFFAELDANRKRLDQLADRIHTYYILGDTVIINIEGAASASGRPSHNLSLSGRRIASMRKYIYMYFDLLETPICPERLQIKIVKKGSREAKKGYPRSGDCRIYNTDASRDRNIKIVGLETKPTSCQDKAILDSVTDEDPCGRIQSTSFNGL